MAENVAEAENVEMVVINHVAKDDLAEVIIQKTEAKDAADDLIALNQDDLDQDLVLTDQDVQEEDKLY